MYNLWTRIVRSKPQHLSTSKLRMEFLWSKILRNLKGKYFDDDDDDDDDMFSEHRYELLSYPCRQSPLSN